MAAFTEEDYKIVEQEWFSLRDAAFRRCTVEGERQMIQKAFDFATEAHKNVRRRSGEPYILHPMAVARIVVSEIGLGYKSICAALLHDVVEDTDYTVEDIEHLFGKKIATLVDGLTKIKIALDDNQDETSLQAENFKRILLTLNDDVRIIIIKLADRLHNVRTIEYMPEYKRDKILSETMYIFVPLAHRLGLHNIKTEMENIWLRYKEPDVYEEMTSRLQEFAGERSRMVDEFIVPINKVMERLGYAGRYNIIKRLKSPYSIWRKMNTKNIPFEEVFDIYAIRIVFQPVTGSTERDQCWKIFTGITDIYSYKNERTRDWVKEPKSNGYEALHLTAMAPGGLWVEIQIQTERMNNIAERGVAAHWIYKKMGAESYNSEVETWIQKVRTILENPDANAIRFLDDFHKEMVSSEIYIFTPNGEPRTLPKGSTVIDFAYLVHTEIGDHAIAAKVNQRLVPLTTVLKNGDQVEVITSETGHPKREWLESLHSQRARTSVLNYFKRTNEEAFQKGRDLFHQRLQELGVKENNRDEATRNCLEHYKVENKSEFYLRIGLGMIDLSDMQKVVKSGFSGKQILHWGIKVFRVLGAGTIDRKKEYILKEDIESGTSSFVTAPCCAPIPGDPAIGFVGDDNIVTIHKQSCPVADNLASINGDKIVSVRWSRHFVTAFLVRIDLEGIDRVGILEDLTRVITVRYKVNMRKMSIESVDGVFTGSLELYVHNTDDLNEIMREIGTIRGITSVKRTEMNTI